MTKFLTVTTEPQGEVLSPTPTHYQQLSADLMKALDQIVAVIPPLAAEQMSTVKFVRGHLTVPIRFCETVIGAVEQIPQLQAVGKLDLVAGRDTLQFINAFWPVYDKVLAFAKGLKFTVQSRQATLAGQSLQVYQIAKGLGRDLGSQTIAGHVASMKRDLDRPGFTKAQRAERQSPVKVLANANDEEVKAA